ncbi:UNVERIFIED_CONTAM: hypothetical protein RMT77_000025 [Armadillidium vulgare]
MGIVTQLLYGDDNKVRQVFVRTPGGQQNLYSIKHLYPLELSLTHRGSGASSTSSDNVSSDLPKVTPSLPSDQRVIHVRPLRKAAVAAKRRLVDPDTSEDSE